MPLPWWLSRSFVTPELSTTLSTDPLCVLCRHRIAKDRACLGTAQHHVPRPALDLSPPSAGSHSRVAAAYNYLKTVAHKLQNSHAGGASLALSLTVMRTVHDHLHSSAMQFFFMPFDTF